MTIGITDARWLLWSTPTPSASTEIEPHPRLRDIRSLEAPSIQQDHLNRNNPEIADSNELFQNSETLTVAPNRTEVGKCCRSRPGCTAIALILAVQPVAAKSGLHKHHHSQSIRNWGFAGGSTLQSQPPVSRWRYDEAESAPAGH